MTNRTDLTLTDFMKLMLTNFEHHSSSDIASREYLISENLNPDQILQEGLDRIALLQQRLSVKNLPKDVMKAAMLREEAGSYEIRKRAWSHKSVVRLIQESGNPDPINEIKKKARTLVVKAFEMGWEGPPFSPMDLAKYIGIDVKPNDAIVDAQIQPVSNSFQIQYNPYQMPTRINFSVSHEIAHTLFSDCAEEIRNRENKPVENRELEFLCNAAAAEIQLPYAIFSHHANQVSLSIDGLIELAKMYKASLESVFIRYTEVIDKPCIVLIGIFVNENKISLDYYKASRLSNVVLPDQIEIPGDSKAYECKSPGWTGRETVEWSFLGESYEASFVGISPYRRDNKPRVGMLLFPSKHIPQSPDSGKIMLEYGDATKPRGKGKKIIAQLVNTTGGLGRGFGYSLVKNYPVVSTEMKNWHAKKDEFILGNINLIKIDSSLSIFQMLAQKGLYPKGSEIPLRYDALRQCLIKLRETALEMKCSVHMPAIGAGQAGGNWSIIIGMIHDELVNFGVKVNIYLLPGAPFNPKHKTNLTIFKEDSTWESGKLF